MTTPVKKRELKRITDTIVRKYRPEKIILFGSYAWGRPNRDSDVDLFVVKQTKKRRMDREYELRMKLFEDRFPPMDLLIYTPHELQERITKDRNLFLEDIVSHGVVLYSKN